MGTAGPSVDALGVLGCFWASRLTGRLGQGLLALNRESWLNLGSRTHQQNLGLPFLDFKGCGLLQEEEFFWFFFFFAMYLLQGVEPSFVTLDSMLRKEQNLVAIRLPVFILLGDSVSRAGGIGIWPNPKLFSRIFILLNMGPRFLCISVMGEGSDQISELPSPSLRAIFPTLSSCFPVFGCLASTGGLRSK